ncbi:MAG TPA: sugar porter family MFS transporter [Steroidobacteraceae bacterium]|jgi:sugar porter (SP) family MFS transporter
MPTRAQLRIIIVASLAGLLFGFDTAVISGVTQDLRAVFALSPAGLGIAVSTALWGTLIGALVAGRPGDRFGTRDVLKVIGLLYLIAALGCALAPSLSVFLLGRFLIGVAIGGSSVLAPVYIAESAPAERRGALVGLFQINIVIGILTAYISNFVLARLLMGAELWRWKLAVPALPALIFLVLLLFIPHSPRWLIHRGRYADADDSLRRLGIEHPDAVIESIRSAESVTPQRAEFLSWSQHSRLILLAVGIGMFNQLSGINAILYYLGDIFSAAGFSGMSADLQSIAVGATNLIATLIAMTLIDRVGRRMLLLIGAIGTALAQAGVAVVMALSSGRALLLPLLITFIAAFAISQGAVIWVFLSEIFPTAIRARGQSLGSATHWIMNALISALFPAVAARAASLPFAFFSLMMLLQFFLVLRFVPETRGVSLERMPQRLRAWSATTD